RQADSTRLAACWYSFTPFQISYSLPDAAPHKLSVYCLDWDASGREQIVELLDSNLNVLQSQTVANFQKGTYVSFAVNGSFVVRVRPIKGNAVVSGLFLDPLVSSVPQASQPVLSPAGGSLASGQKITLSSSTSGAAIRYTLDGSTPTSASALYTAPFSLTASATVNARAFAANMTDSTVSSGSFTVATPVSAGGAKVSFLGVDSRTSGTWKGVLGLEGYSLPPETHTFPSTIGVGSAGNLEWTWSLLSNDSRALQRSYNSTRIAACAYGSSFYYDIDLRDGKTHTVSLYCLDWEQAGRVQTVEIFDPLTQSVLHSYTLSSFSNGVYLKYAVEGRLLVRLTRKAGPNAVVSGVFVDSSPIDL
ncbi:MAG TPA: chitobiase/beta-hexosaminidase C-terminal domain-containing protein, partial [Verrucomicrobiae bacterium]|nr:chitobiase/beta-hexosaminidase C-terminal domain-containing protein [Verrucomicrobiae bacterium]